MSSAAQTSPTLRVAEPTWPRSQVDRVAAVMLAVLLATWSIHLWPQWWSNPDLSHGLFTPLVFVLLLQEARRGARRFVSASGVVVGAIGLLGASGLILLVGAGLYAAALEWTHALVEFLLAGALCALLTTAWLAAALDRVRAVPLNWPAAVSILVWALSAPIPPGTYARLTQGLQGGVTEAVLSSLQWIGIAAFRDGNVIHLAHATVGVEEACSGVRSLLSCVFAGFFLSALMLQTTWKRVLLIALSAPLAIAMNFFRSLTLTLLANAGVEIRGPWHDFTGFAVLGVTAALLAGLALLLNRSHDGAGMERAEHVVGPSLQTGIEKTRLARALLLTTLSLALGILILFVAATHPSPHKNDAPPNLIALLPETAEGWTVSTRDDLYHFSSQLRTEYLAERTYRREDARGTIQITVYLAYWPAGQASVSLVASHTPDACWPGSGWTEDRRAHGSATLTVAKQSLPEAQYRLFRFDDYPQHVWYWHLVGGKIFHQDVGSPRELLSLAWNYGFRDEENQVFARVSSNRTWEEISREPLLADLANRLHAIGF